MGSKEIIIDDFTNDIDCVTDLSDILGDAIATLEEIHSDNEPFGKGDPKGGSDELVRGNIYGDGAFPDSQRFPYDPKNVLIQQFYEWSCIAACIQMLLNDHGVRESEAFIREVANVCSDGGGYLRDVPEALTRLGLGRLYTYKTNLTIEDLSAATGDGKAAIVSVKVPGGSHAIVIDGIEAGMVLIRDPSGSTYKVTIQDFKRQWNGVAVIPAP